MADPLVAELTAHLQARSLHPTTAWLQGFLSTVRANTPIPALKQTALFRLLATDISISLKQPPHTVFPQNIANGASQSRYVAGPIICQVLDIEDIGHSRWTQVESIEAKERGEMTKGREVIRVVADNDNGPAQPTIESKGPFKLLLQDSEGVKIYAFDLCGISGLNTSMTMGVKLLLRNCDVRRGAAILEPGNVQILGGKIEALDKAWKDGKKQRLMDAARTGEDGANGLSRRR